MKSKSDNNDLATYYKLLSQASDYTEIFSQCNGTAVEQKNHLRKEYKKLVKALHPDKFTDPNEKQIAQEAFTLLGKFVKEGELAIENGTYGKPLAKIEFKTKNAKHILIKKIATGDIADIYSATSVVGGKEKSTIVKITRNSNDNDLATNEQKLLQKLGKAKDSDNLKHFVTSLIDSFTYNDGAQNHGVTVLENPEIGFIDLETLKNNYFPKGLDPLHVGWIWRRLLLGIEFAHQNNIVHGAILPSNILIHPALHGVVLSDWCYGIDLKKTPKSISAIVSSKKDWYPPEVLAKETPFSGTDTYLAAKSMIFLLGGDPVEKTFPDTVPIEYQRYFKGCTVNSSLGRPSDAISLLNEFDSILEKIGTPYHPRTYMALAI
jgi:serine/threonine protein kinase